SGGTSRSRRAPGRGPLAWPEQLHACTQLWQPFAGTSVRLLSFRPRRGVRSKVLMEAATPLRKPHVRTIGDRLVVDGLVVEDEAAVRLVREREEAGSDPVRVVADAIEIGARVLDREQAGANAEFVKGELDKATREVELVLAERTREV